MHKRISAVACVGCRLKKAKNFQVKFGRPPVDSSLEVRTKFRRDPFSRFALVNEVKSHKRKAVFLPSTYTRNLNLGDVFGPKFGGSTYTRNDLYTTIWVILPKTSDFSLKILKFFYFLFLLV